MRLECIRSCTRFLKKENKHISLNKNFKKDFQQYQDNDLRLRIDDKNVSKKDIEDGTQSSMRRKQIERRNLVKTDNFILPKLGGNSPSTSRIGTNEQITERSDHKVSIIPMRSNLKSNYLAASEDKSLKGNPDKVNGVLDQHLSDMLFSYKKGKNSDSSSRMSENPYNRFLNHSERSHGRKRYRKNVKFSKDVKK
ncbi:unnamed protein product [Moneuplotes crassus]|uniref:Uncharacterized protein n=1 Tax=Euplotes crassus TaxID=5936 RepID=A0AAD1XQJ1_EUPCR|nr:unnamed protein product [Moneuplotes crassus]